MKSATSIKNLVYTTMIYQGDFINLTPKLNTLFIKTVIKSLDGIDEVMTRFEYPLYHEMHLTSQSFNES